MIKSTGRAALSKADSIISTGREHLLGTVTDCVMVHPSRQASAGAAARALQRYAAIGQLEDVEGRATAMLIAASQRFEVKRRRRRAWGVATPLAARPTTTFRIHAERLRHTCGQCFYLRTQQLHRLIVKSQTDLPIDCCIDFRLVLNRFWEAWWPPTVLKTK